MDKSAHINFWYAALAVIAVLWVQQWLSALNETEVIPYSEFQELLEQGGIVEIAISTDRIRGKLSTPRSNRRTHIQTNRVDPNFAKELAQYDVEFTGVIESHFISNLMSWIVPIFIFAAVWLFIIRKIGASTGAGGLLSVGKSKAKVYLETNTEVTFEDVAGVDEAKEELKEIVDFLRDPKAYGRLGARVPRGVLLVGPPGTGKTLLARALAGEAVVPFFSINGSEFVEMFVGVGAARVRDLFEQARGHAPCIIFIDELDALGRARGAGPLMGGHDEKEQTLNQLLSELDGFDTKQGIVLLAATNRPEILDPALLRAGRFDRQVLVDRPDKLGRVAILKVHVKGVAMADDVDLSDIAALTPGFTGADLANLVNEAAIVATRRNEAAVTSEHFTAAIERIVAGLEKKNRLMNEYERKVVAFHESGHALVTMALPGTDTVHKVSIIPRGIGSLGYNIQRPTEDRYLMTQRELFNKMTALLGGRAAEVLAFDELSTGASDDLEKATQIARSMVMRYGMDETLGLVAYAEPSSSFMGDQMAVPFHTRNYSEKTAREIDEAIRSALQSAFSKAIAILTRNRALLDEAARELLKCETLQGDQLPQPIWDDASYPDTSVAAVKKVVS